MIELSTERLFLVDPFDEDHKKLITDFEKEQGIQRNISEYLEKIKSSTREEYKKIKTTTNEINEVLFIESSKQIKDLCFISGEKDISTCIIVFSALKGKPKVRKLISLATDFAFHTLGMKEVFIRVDINDKNMVENLKDDNFENLGIENGNFLYLKEYEESKRNQRKIS